MDGEAGLNDIYWSPDSKKIASVSNDHTVRVWNVEEGETESVMVTQTCQ